MRARSWGFSTVRNGNVEVEKRRNALQFGAVGRGEFEAEDFAARGRIDGRMDSAQRSTR